jgi:hypothetical protein
MNYNCVLADYQCDYGQGYLFSEPITAYDFERIFLSKTEKLVELIMFIGTKELSFFCYQTYIRICEKFMVLFRSTAKSWVGSGTS